MHKFAVLTMLSILILGACGAKVSDPGKAVCEIYQAKEVSSLGDLQDHFKFTEEAASENVSEDLLIMWKEMTQDGSTKSIEITHTKMLNDETAVVSYKAEFNNGNKEEGVAKLKKLEDKWKIIID